MLSTLLKHCGYETISATSVAEALDRLGDAPVDVLLSDLGLPDGDGLNLVARAKAVQPELIAIALTGRGSDNDLELGEKAGFDHYLTKPFDFHQLRTILGQPQTSAA